MQLHNESTYSSLIFAQVMTLHWRVRSPGWTVRQQRVMCSFSASSAVHPYVFHIAAVGFMLSTRSSCFFGTHPLSQPLMRNSALDCEYNRNSDRLVSRYNACLLAQLLYVQTQLACVRWCRKFIATQRP